MGSFQNCCQATGVRLTMHVALVLIGRGSATEEWEPVSYPLTGIRDSDSGGLSDVAATPYSAWLWEEVSRRFSDIEQPNDRMLFPPSMNSLAGFTAVVAYHAIQAHHFGGRYVRFGELDIACSLFDLEVYRSITIASEVKGDHTPRALMGDHAADQARLVRLNDWLRSHGIFWRPLDEPNQYDDEEEVEKYERALARFDKEPAILSALERYAESFEWNYE